MIKLPFKCLVYFMISFGLLNSRLFAQEIEVPLPKGEITNEKISVYVNQVIDELIKKDLFSGSVLIAKDGIPFYKRAEGEASKEFKVPNRIDTKFNLGSMNKMFTGVAIVLLEQQGKLSFHDKVGKYLPDYPNQDVREKVTIHHLLTHTSGMGFYWMEFFNDPNWARIKTVSDYDNLANKNPLAFEPGEKFMYSNCGPLVLGLIIEKISGISYDDFIRKNITGPANMINTDCYDISDPIPNLARGYAKMSMFGEQYDHWKNNLFMNPVKGGPAGGGYSTVEDLFNFSKALQNFKLLDIEHLDILTKGKVVEEFPTGSGETIRDQNKKYAYLFQEKMMGEHRIIGHSGGAAGISSTMRMCMNSGYTIIILSNIDMGMSNLYPQIEKLLIKK